MADVFVSYSRRDIEFARSLSAALATNKRDVWIDWEDIPPTAEWLAEILRAIEAADAFLFVITQHSLRSKTCLQEVDHAVSNRKRIVPLLLENVNDVDVPDSVRKINWIRFDGADRFEAGMKDLDASLRLDIEWVRMHTRILVRAKEWDAKKSDQSYLLSGTDLGEALLWLSHQKDHEPMATELHVRYIVGSQKAASFNAHRQLRGYFVVSVLFGTVQFAATYFLAFDEISENGLVTLAPIWASGILFGLVGLTIARRSIRRALLMTAVIGVCAYLFLAPIWARL